MHLPKHFLRHLPICNDTSWQQRHNTAHVFGRSWFASTEILIIHTTLYYNILFWSQLHDKKKKKSLTCLVGFRDAKNKREQVWIHNEESWRSWASHHQIVSSRGSLDIIGWFESVPKTLSALNSAVTQRRTHSITSWESHLLEVFSQKTGDRKQVFYILSQYPSARKGLRFCWWSTICTHHALFNIF